MLNDIKVKAAKPKDKLYRVFDGQGTLILLSANRSIEKRGAHELTKRPLQKCGEIFRFTIAESKAIYNQSC
jgi:hypothetical protein